MPMTLLAAPGVFVDAESLLFTTQMLYIKIKKCFVLYFGTLLQKSMEHCLRPFICRMLGIQNQFLFVIKKAAIKSLKHRNTWAASSENVSSRVCDQVTFKPACSATETS